jgi:hypothetical protein
MLVHTLKTKLNNSISKVGGKVQEALYFYYLYLALTIHVNADIL